MSDDIEKDNEDTTALIPLRLQELVVEQKLTLLNKIGPAIFRHSC